MSLLVTVCKQQDASELDSQMPIKYRDVLYLGT